MPRQGDGSSHNGPFPEDGENIIHGAGKVESSKVDRADKTAPLPEVEKGLALEDSNASGGQSAGLKQGGQVGQGGGADTN